MDIRILQILNAIPITQVDVVDALEVPTLDIRGADFSSAEEVHINGVPSPDFVILSKTRVLAQIPDLGGDAITKVEAYSSNLTRFDESRLVFGLGRHSKTVSDIEQLLQRFLKLVFTTPGSDAFNTSHGGGIKDNVGALTDVEGRSITAGVTISLNTAKNQMIQMQNRDPNISASERLLDATIIDSVWNARTMTLNVKLVVTNETGATVSTQIGITNNE